MPGPGNADNPDHPGDPASRPTPASGLTPNSRAASASRPTPASRADRAGYADPLPEDLARYLAASTGLPQATAGRVVADVVTYFSETVEAFVIRRHAELKQRQLKNDEIWPRVAAELGQRRFAAPRLSERQLRRMVYH
jgi:hypothetical protein